MKEFAGTVAVVTGGCMGIGRAIAERCMAEGCTGLVVGDLATGGLDETAAALRKLGQGRVVMVAMDAGKLEDVQRLLDTTLAEFGAVTLAATRCGPLPALPILD